MGAAISEDFPSTHWSVIARAVGEHPQEARTALEILCHRYWYPIYVYIRRRAANKSQAEDVTQAFFEHLLHGNVIQDAVSQKGRFRAYLIESCKNFLTDVYRSERASKRRGRLRMLRLDFTSAARRYSLEPADSRDAETDFSRRWAISLLNATFNTLECEYRAEGHEALFQRLKPVLTGEIDAQPYEAIGREMAMSENAVKKAAQRLRHRFGLALRQLISETVDHPEDVDSEIRELFRSLG